MGSLEQMSEKVVRNIWLSFLQFEKFSVIRVLNLKEIKKNVCKAIWESFAESLEKIWENFNYILWKFSGNFANIEKLMQNFQQGVPLLVYLICEIFV